jgi:hypothetical protein
MAKKIVSYSLVLTVLFLANFAIATDGEPVDSTANVTITLNGLTMVFDSQTGCILNMSYPEAGTFLNCERERASIFDMAYPIEKFEPLRVAPRFSKNVEITKTNDSIRLHWEKLASSKPYFPVSGTISASVTFKATDNNSIIMSCEIDNQSDNAIRQVIFPDFLGLIPFTNAQELEYRTAAYAFKPFIVLQPIAQDNFYAVRVNQQALPFDTILPWADLSSKEGGGFGIFSKQLEQNPSDIIIMHISEATLKLRLIYSHYVEIKKGQHWKSEDYYLTPHKYGWIKSMQSFHSEFPKNARGDYPVAEHVRNGTGLRSVSMTHNVRFSNVLQIAKKSEEYGLNEILLLDVYPPFGSAGVKTPRPELGTEEELINAISACKKMGINITIGIDIETKDPNWQKNVLTSCKSLISHGLTSISIQKCPPNINKADLETVVSQIRPLAKRSDPNSTFSMKNADMKFACKFCDYVLRSSPSKELFTALNGLHLPRLSYDVGSNFKLAQIVFAQSGYLNIPYAESASSPDSIESNAELGRTLKDCKLIRSKFSTYFTEGTFLADQILAADNPACHISSYVLPESMLIVVVNLNAAGGTNLQCNLLPWFNGDSQMELRTYGNTSDLISTTKISTKEKAITIKLPDHFDIAVFECKVLR